MELKLEKVRCTFPKLFKAEPFAGDAASKPAFSIGALFPPEHPAYKQGLKAIETVGREKWKEKWPAFKKSIESKDALCLHNGDAKADLEGYAGNWFVSARAYTRPLVIDRDRSPLTEADGKPYAGCYVNLLVDIYAQDSQYGKRINAGLKGVQFYKDGDAFGGGAPADPDAFDDVSDTGDDEDDLA
jgi:hypothetical protein